MTLHEFVLKLEETGFDVAFHEFPKEEKHDPPFMCYEVQESTAFWADGIVYHITPNVQVKLYTIRKDIEVQKKVENAMDSFYYLKEEGMEESEKMYLTTYHLAL